MLSTITSVAPWLSCWVPGVAVPAGWGILGLRRPEHGKDQAGPGAAEDPCPSWATFGRRWACLYAARASMLPACEQGLEAGVATKTGGQHQGPISVCSVRECDVTRYKSILSGTDSTSRATRLHTWHMASKSVAPCHRTAGRFAVSPTQKASGREDRVTAARGVAGLDSVVFETRQTRPNIFRRGRWTAPTCYRSTRAAEMVRLTNAKSVTNRNPGRRQGGWKRLLFVHSCSF